MLFESLHHELLTFVFGNRCPSEEKIQEMILRCSDLFTFLAEKRSLHYLSHPQTLQGYLLYFVPITLHKLYKVLLEITRHPLFLSNYEELRILDLGCGPAPALLAFVELEKQNLFPRLALHYTGVDFDYTSLQVAEKLVQKLIPLSPRIRYQFLRRDLRTGKVFQEFRKLAPQFVILSNLVGELETQGITATEVAQRLKPLATNDTHLATIIIEPATRKTSQTLHKLRDLLLEHNRLSLCTMYR